MGGYRSDLEAAQARIEKLEAAIDAVEAERSRLEGELKTKPPPSSSPMPWVLAAGAAVIAVMAAVAALRGSDAPPAPTTLRVAPPAAAPEPPEPVVEDAPPVEDSVEDRTWRDPTLAAMRPEPAAEEVHPEAFYGQYWRARVAAAGESGLAVGTECLITTDPGLHLGAGVARVRCGSQVLHQTSVTPPWRENAGFCHFADDELLCAPVRGSSRPGCWVSTAARQARCAGDVELEIHTLMRDPRDRPPPASLRTPTN
ncbi:MAG: hypothetical protein H6719_15315 [Sandaracinaceae bacterium]|nr:hypothetical protein [Sandaracinaceae bacterium]